mmetsp:Transcript_26099/g.49986  ORF Transcript_26099/g.49986 Transcript_26099/m.49986 type:complete len:190 (-) Transcript_26099:81-650(-)
MQFGRLALLFLVATAQQAYAAKLLRAGPDVAAEVAAEAAQNIQVHDGFLSQEHDDVEKENELKAQKTMSALSTGKWVYALDRDLKTPMLIQEHLNNTQPAIKDPCGGITCGSLKCPAGFTVTDIEGHCCSYCVNPNIKVPKAVEGATGKAGGVASTFCQDVWCFPTMCSKPEQNPTTTNGQCCPVCPAL